MLEPQSEHVLQHRTGDTLTYPNSSGGSLKLQRRLPKTIGASRKRRFMHQRPLLRAAEAALHALDSLRRSSDRSSLPSAVLQAIAAFAVRALLSSRWFPARSIASRFLYGDATGRIGPR